MKPFFNVRTKRSTALVALFVWLFALVSGVANACLIQPEKMQDHGSGVAHSSAAEKRHAVSAVHVGAIPDHAPELETSKSQCLKVCDDSSQSFAKQQVGFDLTHPVLMPLPGVAWGMATPGVSARGLAAVQRPPYSRLSIRVRLSRLAL